MAGDDELVCFVSWLSIAFWKNFYVQARIDYMRGDAKLNSQLIRIYPSELENFDFSSNKLKGILLKTSLQNSQLTPWTIVNSGLF
jgi:hypothetical protein